jgi:hypothetical protein
LPLDALQKLWLGQLTRDPLIEYRLYSTRKRFETDHHLRAEHVKRRKYLQLPQMVIRIVVVLAEEYDVTVSGAFEDL